MEWETKIVFTPFNADQEALLNKACAGEWEPYAVSGSFHYFKREKKERHGEQPAAIPTVQHEFNLPAKEEKNKEKNQKKK